MTRPEHIRGWWTKEARVEYGKLVVGWSGYGWECELDIADDTPANTVVWRRLRSNMQNTNAWEGATITDQNLNRLAAEVANLA